MINIVNYLERIKSLDKLLCESKLSILKSSRAGFLQKKLSQKYIIKRLLEQMKDAAKLIERVSPTISTAFPEDLERSIVEKIGEVANSSLSCNYKIRKGIREMDTEIEQLERLKDLF